MRAVGSTVVASKEVSRAVPAGGSDTVDASKLVTTSGSKGDSCVVGGRAKRS